MPKSLLKYLKIKFTSHKENRKIDLDTSTIKGIIQDDKSHHRLDVQRQRERNSERERDFNATSTSVTTNLSLNNSSALDRRISYGSHPISAFQNTLGLTHHVTTVVPILT